MKRIDISKKAVALNLSDVISMLKANINLVMIISFYTAGLIAGSLTSLKISAGITDYSNSFNVFLILNLISLMILTADFIMGLCCVGIPLVFLNSAFSGFYIGSIIAHYLKVYELKEIFVVLLRMPFAVIFSTTVILAAAASVDMCEDLIKFTFFRKALDKTPEM